MTEQFVRIEGSVSPTIKDWVEQESLRTNTPMRIIVGNAIALYKAENDKSIIGQSTQFEYIAELKLKKLLQELRKSSPNWGINTPKLVNYSQSVADILSNMVKRKTKIARDLNKPFRNGLIVDFLEDISKIRHSNKELYINCVEIVRKSIHKDDIILFEELSKENRGLEVCSYIDTLKNSPIKYTGGSLGDSSKETEIKEMANNCMMTSKKDREEKIQHTMKLISDIYAVNEIQECITIFQHELDRLDVKRID